MPPKKPSGSSTNVENAKRPKAMDPGRQRLIAELVVQLKRERERLGPKATFEQRQDATFEILKDAFWQVENDELQGSLTDAEEIDVEGKKYRRLEQGSSATYFGRFGAHHVEEALYREVGVHNGPTIKPIELKFGIVEHMTPDMARIAGALTADEASRELNRTLHAVGYTPPSRSFLAKRMTSLGGDVVEVVAELEEAARVAQELPANVASVSCGLDRMAVRMSEVVDGPCERDEPYERKPPPQKEHCYRMAFVASTSMYDIDGKELMTWRYATKANADPVALAARVAADVSSIATSFPDAPVHCVQDGGAGLDVLPNALKLTLPDDVAVVELVDFEHLLGYLDKIVDAGAPGDPHDMKTWYRNELLVDDGAIDRIQRNLRDQGRRLRLQEPASDEQMERSEKTRTAIAAALSFIRTRKDKMRYASYHRQNLPIGSGATESTCWQMQQRVKLPGQSWVPQGLSGILAIRALVLSERWNPAWNHFAKSHRAEISICV